MGGMFFENELCLKESGSNERLRWRSKGRFNIKTFSKECLNFVENVQCLAARLSEQTSDLKEGLENYFGKSSSSRLKNFLRKLDDEVISQHCLEK